VLAIGFVHIAGLRNHEALGDQCGPKGLLEHKTPSGLSVLDAIEKAYQDGWDGLQIDHYKFPERDE
jgi:hypothetical protein